MQESDACGETSEPPDDPTSSECSAGPCSEGADKRARRNSEKDSEHSAASAAQGTVEMFEPQAFGTLEEHVQSHDYPAHVATCGACKFWKNRWCWSQTFSYCHPVSGKKETWLACKNGFGVCLICTSHPSTASAASKYARCQGSLLRKDAITQHSKGAEHIAAHQAMMQRLRATDSQDPPATVAVFDGHEPAESAKAASNKPTAHSTVTRTPHTTTGRRAVIATRAMLETTSSFDSIDVWLGALTRGDREALESSWHTKRLVSAMAQYERIQTYRLLQEGAVFRLAADGQQRTYQVEIGTVLWSFPASLEQLCRHGQQEGWLQELGPRGPWVVERIIGMREFPQEMNCDGKVAMIEECVRRACQAPGGYIDVKLYQHVCAETRAWCSDGADLGVATAASASFPGLKFHAWDESHSAQRMCCNAMVDDEEITTTDKLLVTGKRPYSLAKFLSTSMAFRKKMGDAQLADEVSFVKNFGWAPQRFNSRARPYARESRRWKSIFDAVAAEAASADRDRRALARMYLQELGGENSSRLVLGGLLADLSAEHYSWVASGDERNPDATRVQERPGAFLERLRTQFDEAMILTLPDTYTGVTLEFLKKSSYYPIGNSVQAVGIGDWNSDPSARAIIHQVLARVRVVVANMREFMKVYRPEHSWLHAFTAFRLPSPLAE